MGFSAICFSHKYHLIQDISGKAKKQCSTPLKFYVKGILHLIFEM